MSYIGRRTRQFKAKRRYKTASEKAIAYYRGKSRVPKVWPRAIGVLPGSLGIEFKYHDVGAANYACDATAGVVTYLNDIDVGNTAVTRIGRQITIKSIQVEGIIVQEDAICGPNLVRIMIVYDKQTNGAAPTIADIMGGQSSIRFRNLDYRSRFVILYNKTFVIGQVDNTATQAVCDARPRKVKLYRKCNLKTVYDGTAGGVADCATGGLFMITMGHQATGAASTATLAVRLRYLG